MPKSYCSKLHVTSPLQDPPMLYFVTTWRKPDGLRTLVTTITTTKIAIIGLNIVNKKIPPPLVPYRSTRGAG